MNRQAEQRLDDWLERVGYLEADDILDGDDVLDDDEYLAALEQKIHDQAHTIEAMRQEEETRASMAVVVLGVAGFVGMVLGALGMWLVG